MDWLLAIYPILKMLWVVWFLMLFVGLVVWVMRPSAKARYRAMGEIPLQDDPNAKPR